MVDAARATGAPIPFGKYLLDEEIATGGMARVYRARLRGVAGFEKKLVVKQVRPELAKDPRFVELFVREAKAVVEMAHPNVVPVYELGVIDDVYFLAMEYVEGATLAEILEQGPLDPALVAHVGVMVSEALQYAHERLDLVHRDVTPRNVIVDRSGHVRLLDFGIAAPSAAMNDGEVFGSHGYMSPEQARGESADARSDLFSLGCVLFECLSGRPAYQRATAAETRDALLSGEPPTLGPEVHLVLGQIVHFLLGTTPAQRPESAASAAKAFRHWLATMRPEGVATELAARVEQARSAPKRPASGSLDPSPSNGAPSHGDSPSTVRGVRSIATSAVLRSVLSEPPPAVVSRTVRIERQRPRSRRIGPLVVLTVTVAALASIVVLQLKNDRAPSQGSPRPSTTRAHPVVPPVSRPSKQGPVAVVEPTPVPPQPEERPGQVSVNANPWANVSIDGRPIGSTPIRTLTIAAGTHTIAFDCPPLGRQARGSFRVAPGESIRVVGNLTTDPPAIDF